MAWLKTSDLRSVLSFLREIYAFSDARSWQVRAVSALPKLVSCDWVTYMDHFIPHPQRGLRARRSRVDRDAGLDIPNSGYRHRARQVL